MKILTSVIFLLGSLTAFGSENFVCTKNNFQLTIKISEGSDHLEAFWILKLIKEESVAFEGSGAWQKEADSADAFSSYDDSTAISFKNDRAVFVMPSDQAIYFPVCQKF